MLRERNLKVNSIKLKLGQLEIEMFGFTIGQGKITISGEKRRMIKDLQCPKNYRELEAAFGFLNYFSSFVPQFGKIEGELRGVFKLKKRKLSEDEQNKANEKHLKNSKENC